MYNQSLWNVIVSYNVLSIYKNVEGNQKETILRCRDVAVPLTSAENQRPSKSKLFRLPAEVTTLISN